VRGTCRYYNPQKHFGFLRYYVGLDNLTVTDPGAPDSPCRDAFFIDANLPADLDLGRLPSRDTVFEFTLVPGQEPGKKAAVDVDRGLRLRAGVRAGLMVRFTHPTLHRRARSLACKL